MIKIDKSLLSELQKGNHQAFEKIFFYYYQKVKAFLFGYVKTENDAEELTEEIFVELWLNHEKINVEKSFDSYLYTIARNKAINFLKRKHLAESIIEIQPSNHFHSPEDEYIALEKELLIEMIVEKMPNQRKKIYQLRQQGLSNNEIAKQLETTKRNVESQISLALKEIHNSINYILIFIL